MHSITKPYKNGKGPNEQSLGTDSKHLASGIIKAMKIHRTPASLPSKPIAPPAQSPTSVAAQGESPVAISFPAKTVKPDSSAATSRAVDQLESTPTAAGSASTQLSFVERAAQIRGENFEALKQELRGKPLSFQLNRVNSFFNRNIRYTSDMKNQGQNDYWQTRSESLNLGKGDCEDYALAKYQTLKELGIPEKDLHVFYVKNKNNIAHGKTQRSEARVWF